MVNREDNDCSEEVRKGWKEARCSGLWGEEVYLLRIIEEKGRRWWILGYQDAFLQDDALNSIDTSAGP